MRFSDKFEEFPFDIDLREAIWNRNAFQKKRREAPQGATVLPRASQGFPGTPRAPQGFPGYPSAPHVLTGPLKASLGSPGGPRARQGFPGLHRASECFPGHTKASQGIQGLPRAFQCVPGLPRSPPQCDPRGAQGYPRPPQEHPRERISNSPTLNVLRGG